MENVTLPSATYSWVASTEATISSMASQAISIADNAWSLIPNSTVSESMAAVMGKGYELTEREFFIIHVASITSLTTSCVFSTGTLIYIFRNTEKKVSLAQVTYPNHTAYTWKVHSISQGGFV